MNAYKNIPFLSKVSHKVCTISKYDIFSKYWQVCWSDNAQDEENLLYLPVTVKVTVTNGNGYELRSN